MSNSTVPSDSDWGNSRSQNIVSVQSGGAGYPWKTIGIQHGINNPSGGGRDVQHRWGAGANGEDVYLQKEYTSDPKAYTAQLSLSMTRKTRQLMDDLAGAGGDLCLPDLTNLLIRNGCRDLSKPTNYENHVMIVNTTVTGKDFSGSLKKGAGTGEAGVDKLNRMLSIDGGRLLGSYKLISADNKSEAEAEAVNIAISYAHHTFAGGDQTAVPANAKVGYSADKGTTWAWTAVNTLTGAGENIDDLAVFQGLLLVASNLVGISYADIDDVVMGTASAYTLAGVWTDFPETVIKVSSNLAVCAGAGGFISESTDGVLWTDSNSSKVVTTEDLTKSKVATEDLFFLGGTNGALVRYMNGVYGVITITGLTTETITALGVPPQRTNWLYVGLDNGAVYVCKDTTKATPVFELVSVNVFSAGSIADFGFAGYRGAYMFILHTKSGASTLYRDISGGAGAGDIEKIDMPTNVGLNSIVVYNERKVLAVGEVVSSKGMIIRFTE